eukprot:UN25210
MLLNKNVDTFFACDTDSSTRRNLEDIFREREIYEINLITLPEVTENHIEKEILSIQSMLKISEIVYIRRSQEDTVLGVKVLDPLQIKEVIDIASLPDIDRIETPIIWSYEQLPLEPLPFFETKKRNVLYILFILEMC